MSVLIVCFYYRLFIFITKAYKNLYKIFYWPDNNSWVKVGPDSVTMFISKLCAIKPTVVDLDVPGAPLKQFGATPAQASCAFMFCSIIFLSISVIFIPFN